MIFTRIFNLPHSRHSIHHSVHFNFNDFQLGAFRHVSEAKHDIAFIQGPPGTGKTTSLVVLLQILWHCSSWIACAPRNSATDQWKWALPPCFRAAPSASPSWRRSSKATTALEFMIRDCPPETLQRRHLIGPRRS